MALPNWHGVNNFNIALKQIGEYSFGNYIFVNMVNGKYIGACNTIPDMRFWTPLEKKIINEDGSTEIFKFNQNNYEFDLYYNELYLIYKELKNKNKNSIILNTRKLNHVTDFLNIILSSFFVKNKDKNFVIFRPFYSKSNIFSEQYITFKILNNSCLELSFNESVFNNDIYLKFFINSLGELINRTDFFNSFSYKFNIN